MATHCCCMAVLASRPRLADLIASPEGFPRRAEMIAAVEHAHKSLDSARQQLVGAHEKWATAESDIVSTLRQTPQENMGNIQRGIETAAKKRRGVWGVVAGQLANLLGISAAVFGQETHASVLTQAHIAIDSAHVALMGRLGTTLQADAAAGVEIRQGMGYLAYAAEEQARLTTALETAGGALLKVESQLAKVKVKVVPQVHAARRVASEIQPTVQATSGLWKDVGSLLRNVMLTTRHDHNVARMAASLDSQHKQAQARLGDTVAALCTALETSAPLPGAPERKSEGEDRAMEVVRQCGAGAWSRTSLRAAFEEIATHSTGFHLKLVDFGVKCAARATETAGADDDDAEQEEVVVEVPGPDLDAEAAAIVEGDDVATDDQKPIEQEVAPQAELRDRYALNAIKRVRYKLDGTSPPSLSSSLSPATPFLCGPALILVCVLRFHRT